MMVGVVGGETLNRLPTSVGTECFLIFSVPVCDGHPNCPQHRPKGHRTHPCRVQTDSHTPGRFSSHSLDSSPVHSRFQSTLGHPILFLLFAFGRRRSKL